MGIVSKNITRITRIPVPLTFACPLSLNLCFSSWRRSVFRRKLLCKPEPFRKLPAKVTSFQALTIKPHNYQSFSGMIRITPCSYYPLRWFLPGFCSRGSEPIRAGLLQLLPEFALLQSLLLSENNPGGCYSAYSPSFLPIRCRFGLIAGYQPVSCEACLAEAQNHKWR